MLVVSADIGNQHSASVVVAVLTTKIAAKKFTVNVYLPANDPLPEEGEVRCRSLYELPKDELGGYRATLTAAQMEQVDVALRVALSLKRT